MMKGIVPILFFFLAGCSNFAKNESGPDLSKSKVGETVVVVNKGPEADLSKFKGGEVVYESSRNIGGGFRVVSQSVVATSGWEGITHMSYVYFKKVKLTAGGEGSVHFSPEKKYVVYSAHRSNKLALLDTNTAKIKFLSDKYIGYIDSVKWDLPNKKVTIKVVNRTKTPVEHKEIVTHLE